MRGNADITISIAALVVAVLGATSAGEAALQQILPRNSVGSAQIQRDAVLSSHVRDGSLLAADFRAGELPRNEAHLWAVIDRDGTIQAGERVTASRRVLTGIYTVTFDRRTSGCAVLATQRSADNGYASARPGGAGVNSVTVNLFATGTAINRFNGAFSVAVFCKAPPQRSVPASS